LVLRDAYKGGRLTKKLKELEEAGFITGFIPWEKERYRYFFLALYC
jgi:hypothetical protein